MNGGQGKSFLREFHHIVTNRGGSKAQQMGSTTEWPLCFVVKGFSTQIKRCWPEGSNMVHRRNPSNRGGKWKRKPDHGQRKPKKATAIRRPCKKNQGGPLTQGRSSGQVP